MSKPFVDRISLYPIKSLDPVVVPAARILLSGALEHDREFALFDEQGNWINGKRDARIHQIRAQYDLESFSVTLSAGGIQPKTLHLLEDRQEIESWLGDFLGRRVSMKRNTVMGFPDDLESPGPTIIGTATLREVRTWFGMADREEASRRFRANVEIGTDVPFWEDRLFGDDGTMKAFRIGEVVVHGVNPCQRCAVPSRDPSTGDANPEFQRVFAARRAEMLPDWATASRFNHYYRLAVNTRIPGSEAGKLLRTGDELDVGSKG